VVAIVFEQDGDAVGQALLGDAALGPGLLLGREGQAGDVGAAAGGGDGQAAPAAADLQQAVPGVSWRRSRMASILAAWACSRCCRSAEQRAE
jgi:hypothetical protein